ncbi:FN3 associated domain-containing protein [Clostridium sp.]|uniref:OmpL47-type beta-barrel domain-containing protein n=1 Tax=Clostridium sp. TaxID=1506 RepID=UPI001B635B1A|nr:FN3 associated domain-containing protein [Clostridium sp.]MBP3916617.1 hypothetical protein [Clostridium sp.]
MKLKSKIIIILNLLIFILLNLNVFAAPMDNISLDNTETYSVSDIWSPAPPSFVKNSNEVVLNSNGDGEGDKVPICNLVTEDFEDTVLNINPTYGGNSTDWTIVTNRFHTGTSSFKSPKTANSSESYFELDILVPSDDLVSDPTAPNFSFWYYVSNEITDYFKFYIDDVEIFKASLSRDWTLYETKLTPGAHKIRFTYWKNRAVGLFEDCVYLDDLSFSEEIIIDKVASGVKEIQYSINGGPWDVYNEPIQINEPTMEISAKVIDNAGNESSIVSETVNRSAEPSYSVNDFTFTIIDNNPSDIRGTLEYSINGGDWTEYTGPFELVYDSNGLCRITMRTINISGIKSYEVVYENHGILETTLSNTSINFGIIDGINEESSEVINLTVTSNKNYNLSFNCLDDFIGMKTLEKISCSILKVSVNDSSPVPLSKGTQVIASSNLPPGINITNEILFYLGNVFGAAADTYTTTLNLIIQQN